MVLERDLPQGGVALAYRGRPLRRRKRPPLRVSFPSAITSYFHIRRFSVRPLCPADSPTQVHLRRVPPVIRKISRASRGAVTGCYYWTRFENMVAQTSDWRSSSASSWPLTFRTRHRSVRLNYSASCRLGAQALRKHLSSSTR